MANKLKNPEPNELWPKVLGHGPKLAFENGEISIRMSSNENHYTVGQGEGEAATLATYTTQITAESRDSLTMAGRHVTGWILLDSSGKLLARIANDDEIVYEHDKIEAFAQLAGLKIKNWGEIPVSRIDKLMTPVDGKSASRQRISRREWIMALAFAGGILFTWPSATRITYDNVWIESLILFLLGASGFAFIGIGLGLGLAASKLPPLPVYIVCGTLSTALAAASLYVQMANFTFWKLTPNQVGATLLGLAIELAAIALWSKVQRDGIQPDKQRSKLDLR